MFAEALSCKNSSNHCDKSLLTQTKDHMFYFERSLLKRTWSSSKSRRSSDRMPNSGNLWQKSFIEAARFNNWKLTMVLLDWILAAERKQSKRGIMREFYCWLPQKYINRKKRLSEPKFFAIVEWTSSFTRWMSPQGKWHKRCPCCFLCGKKISKKSALYGMRCPWLITWIGGWEMLTRSSTAVEWNL